MAWVLILEARTDHIVAATVRNSGALAELKRQYGERWLPLTLDVTDRAGDFAAIKDARDHFGRLDVVVNDASYPQFGCVEELSEDDACNQMEANFVVAVWITQMAFPYGRTGDLRHGVGWFVG
jgi:NAD(P)-dependent dehydrogenase (short-subunit alcohol dehydrogenase family)